MIWKLVLKAGGNSHISRRELFTKVGFQIDQNEYLQFLFIKLFRSIATIAWPMPVHAVICALGSRQFRLENLWILLWPSSD